MSTENTTTQEELNFLQSEANKIDGLQYFRTVLQALEPDGGLFFDINGEPIGESKLTRKKTQLKNKALKSVTDIRFSVIEEVEYEPRRGTKAKGYGVSIVYVFKKGSVIEDILEKYLQGAKMLISFYINSLLERRLEDFKKSSKKGKSFKIAIHGLQQFYGGNKQLKLFSDEIIDEFQEATGLVLNNRPQSYGVVLNQAQKRVFEGILKAFTNSNYKGDEEKDKKIVLQEIYSDNPTSAKTLVKGENAPYKNIDTIPTVKLTQAQIIELAGYDLKSQRQSDKQQVTEAIKHLATTQFCFYWVRLQNKDGKPVKNKNGDWAKEEVMEVGTLLRIKTVRDQSGVLQYYEIQPSATLLDQINNYFLIVPNNWREEVENTIGKRVSSYTYEFLLWLRLQYEHIRRYNKSGGKTRKNKPFAITKSWEDIAIALKMPETMYKRNRKKASAIIQDAYSTAIKLGYLIKVENNGATDTLHLNESYYPKTAELPQA